MAASQEGNNSTCDFNVEHVRQDFPILSREVYGKPLGYLDSGASAQKPRIVVEAVREAYESYYSNVHRGAPVSYTHLTLPTNREV